MFNQNDFSKFKDTMDARSSSDVSASAAVRANTFHTARQATLDVGTGQVRQVHGSASAGLSSISNAGWALASQLSNENVLDDVLSTARRASPPSKVTRASVSEGFSGLLAARREAAVAVVPVRQPRMGR